MIFCKQFSFEAAHCLPYSKLEQKLHGHTYRLDVLIKNKTQSDGTACDYEQLKQIVKKTIIDRLDHSYLNDIIKIPSAENICLWIWHELQNKLPLYEIKVWETLTLYASYHGEDE